MCLDDNRAFKKETWTPFHFFVRCGVPVGAKVLAGSSAAEPGEPGSEPFDADGDAGDGGAVEGKGNRSKRDRGRAGVATAGSGREIVPHFPHIGRVARYREVPVSGFEDVLRALKTREGS